jgi:transposase
VHFLVVSLPHSDAIYVKAYPAETAGAFCEGHVSAFAFFGGIPVSVLYDNTRLAVAKILGDGSRKRSTLFAALESHYVFEGRYGRPGKGNDKGKVEGMVGFARRTFMVPFPRVPDFAEFNIMLEEGCRERQGRIPAWRHDHDRHAHDSRSGGLRGATRDTARCLRQTARAGDQSGTGPIQEHRLLGSGRLCPSRCDGEGLCR